MKNLLIQLKSQLSRLIARGERAEQIKAGEKWDSIVKELSKRK